MRPTVRADFIKVERRAIPRRVLTLRLPMPLHAIQGADGRPDRRWRERVGAILTRLKSRIGGPIEVTISLPDREWARRLNQSGDLVIASLARYGVIDDASSKIVRSLRLVWTTTDGLVVEIRSIAGPSEGRAEAALPPKQGGPA